jgi:hypothetical protein
MLKCKQASQLSSRALDNKLSLREFFALKFHLLICEYCARFSQQLTALNIAISNAGKTIEGDTSIRLPRGTKNTIAQLLNSQQ